MYLGARVLSPVQTPDGTGAIWSAIVQCSGTETGLVLCPIRQQDVTMNCNHDADIGVSCQPSIPGIYNKPSNVHYTRRAYILLLVTFIHIINLSIS